MRSKQSSSRQELQERAGRMIMAKGKQGKRVAAAGGRLSLRHAAFVREFLKDRNATAAYVRAGYKDTPAAEHNASRLMGNEKVRAAIAAIAEKVAERAA